MNKLSSEQILKGIDEGIYDMFVWCDGNPCPKDYRPEHFYEVRFTVDFETLSEFYYYPQSIKLDIEKYVYRGKRSTRNGELDVFDRLPDSNPENTIMIGETATYYNRLYLNDLSIYDDTDYESYNKVYYTIRSTDLEYAKKRILASVMKQLNRAVEVASMLKSSVEKMITLGAENETVHCVEDFQEDEMLQEED